MRRAGPLAALAVVAVTGCALTSRAPPVTLRYFTPPPGDFTPPPAGTAPPRALRLAPVDASTAIDDRIAYEVSPVETRKYETLRWAESPESYVQRALAAALFEEHGFARTLGGSAPLLEVTLVGFEEVREGTRRGGRVVLAYRLSQERAVLAEGVLRVERPVAGRGFGAVVAAVGAALHAAVEELAAIVARRWPAGGRQANLPRWGSISRPLTRASSR